MSQMPHMSPCVQIFQVFHMSQISHVSPKKQSPGQIVTDNISTLARTHMGGQSHLLTFHKSH